MAKAARWATTDAEARERGERTGLDTQVVHAVNDVYPALGRDCASRCHSLRDEYTAWGVRPQG